MLPQVATDISFSTPNKDAYFSADFSPSNTITVPNLLIFSFEKLRLYKAKPRGMLLYDGLEELENISLTGNTIRLGKGVEADVLIDKETISKFHAKIEKTEADFYIEDLNSTNGTMVNGEALSYKERRKLEINDIVQLADVQYKFV